MLFAIAFLACLLFLLLAPRAHAQTYNITPSSSCTLGDALVAAASESVFGACPAGDSTLDTINASAGTYTLTSAIPPLSTAGDISLVGAGATSTIISGAGFTGLTINSTTGTNTFSVSNITLRDFVSSSVDPAFGAVVFNIDANISANNLIVTNNTCIDENIPICFLFASFSETPIVISFSNSAFFSNTTAVLIAATNGNLIFPDPPDPPFILPGGGVTLNITNNTFSNNTGTIVGLTNWTDGTEAIVNLVNNTFANNTVSIGAVVQLNFPPIEGHPKFLATASFRNNIFYSNLDGDAIPTTCPAIVEPSASFISLGGNISDDSTCAGFFSNTNDLNSTDALLEPLTLDLGTWVRAITKNSPAFNNAIAFGSPSTDQRGIGRPQLGGFDSGAYELFVTEPATPDTLAPTGTDIRLPAAIATLLVIYGLASTSYYLIK